MTSSSVVWSDVLSLRLLPHKLIFFVQSAASALFYPYVSLLMKRQLQLNAVQTGIVNGLVALLFILVPSTLNLLAHQLRRHYRHVLAFLTALGGAVSLLLLLLPIRDAGAGGLDRPDRWIISCGRPENSARFQKIFLRQLARPRSSWRDDETDKSDPFINTSVIPTVCGYLCPKKFNNTRLKFLEYKVTWPNRGGSFGISEIVDVVTLDNEETREYFDPHIFDHHVFFSMNWTFHLSCDRIRYNDCIFNLIKRASTNEAYEVIGHRDSNGDSNRDGGVYYAIDSITSPEHTNPVTVPINCGEKEKRAQVTTRAMRSDEGYDDSLQIGYQECELVCLATLSTGEKSNSPSKPVRRVDLTPQSASRTTFWCFLVIRLFLGLLSALALMMFEVALMSSLEQVGGDYTIQRLAGSLGTIIAAPFGGYILELSIKNQGDFTYIIATYCALKLLNAIIILFMDLDYEPTHKSASFFPLNLPSLTASIGFFLVMIVFAGIFWGFIECFLFWHLDELGTKYLIYGWSISIGMITSLPFLIVSGPIIDFFGHMNIMTIGIFAYFLRLFFYSMLQNTDFVLLCEMFEGICMSLLMTAAVSYIGKLSQSETKENLMKIMGTLFFGIGKSAGCGFGGLLIENVGTSEAFRILSWIALGCTLFFIAYRLAAHIRSCFSKTKS